MDVPADLKYSTDHEWVSVNDGLARIGITDFAQDALGDVVFVEGPAAGSTVTAGEPMGEIESTKSVSDLVAPVSGEVTDVNMSLEDEPQLVNAEPYGDGWICVVRMSNPAELNDLLDAAGYAEHTAEQG